MPEQFLHLPPADRNDALEVAAAQSGRPAGLLEKDVWVVWTLDALFRQDFGSALTFKGGTSLSKVFRVIDRFSEDVDLTFDIRSLLPEFASVDGDPIPVSRSAADRITLRARAALREWVSGVAAPALKAAIAREGIHGADVGVEDTNLTFSYPVVVGLPSTYIAPRVLVEFGGRSSGEPADIHQVECDMATWVSDLHFPSANPRVMKVERTFWEKATAAHAFCLQQNLRGERFSRHWFDLARLHLHGIADRALADRDLGRRVAAHKFKFFREKSATGTVVDYQIAVEGGLSLVPEGEGKRVLAEDYGKMATSGLLPADAPPFDQVLAICSDIETMANT